MPAPDKETDTGRPGTGHLHRCQRGKIYNEKTCLVAGLVLGWCWAGGCGCGAAATSSLTHAQLRGSATAPRPPKIRGPPALVLAGERGQCGHGGEKAPHHCSSMRQPGRAAS